MLELKRHHDFQLFLSPNVGELALTNPPSFNWPQPNSADQYRVELDHLDSHLNWHWENVSSPLQINELLAQGYYRWRITDSNDQKSDWMTFNIDASVPDYLPPSASELFDLCKGKSQFLMYFDEDTLTIKNASPLAYKKFKETAKLAVDPTTITYPDHYRRGHEAGKRTAITNVREWIDRDLITLTLLYKFWGEADHGQQAVELLLALAQWSPEGPATLVRPLTWGDEVGLSLSRNLFLAYHWLSPLMTEPEKGFIRPMLVRIAYQLEERMNQDELHQFPGHSHTSRLPGYLGIAALVLHNEFDRSVCERWLNYALMIYRGVLPFYGGRDGSWAEGPFYSSSYSKWHHPFFLAVERLSDFSFYEHPFYKNYCTFAMDFVATDQTIHPFGDGFWCKRESVEWPGFFAQNPLRIYAERFGDSASYKTCRALESQIKCYSLHLLDVIPTIKQLSYRAVADLALEKSKATLNAKVDNGCFYDYGGFGIATRNQLSLSFRASQFANSSHRHADQGNIAFMDDGVGVLVPTGSYGYCFGSSHHKEWTRTTLAHNLPMINNRGQILDHESAVATLVGQNQGKNWYCTQLDLSAAYQGVSAFIRTVFLLADKGVVVVDSIELLSSESVQWRLHSQVEAQAHSNKINLYVDAKSHQTKQYECALISQTDIKPNLSKGYKEAIPYSGGIESDASDDVYHFNWALPEAKTHLIVASCVTNAQGIMFLPNQGVVIELENESLKLVDNKLEYHQH